MQKYSKFVVCMVSLMSGTILSHDRNPDVLSKIYEAVQLYDVESVRSLLSSDSLTAEHKHILKKLVISNINQLKETLEEYPVAGDMTLSAIMLALSAYLVNKQIPRLTGAVVEYNSPRATLGGAAVLLSIGVLGGLVSSYTLFSRVKDLLNNKAVWRIIPEQKKLLADNLAKARIILVLLNDSSHK